MATNLPSVFFEDDQPHSKVKRIMWKQYLQAFIAKTQQAKPYGYNSVICDVFAGTGTYAEIWGTEIDVYGSPLIALRVAFDYFILKKSLPHIFIPKTAGEILIENYVKGHYRVKLLFNEKNTRNYNALKHNVYRMFISYGINVYVCCDPCCVNTSGQTLDNIIFASNDTNIQVCCQITNGAFEDIVPPVLSKYDRMVTFIDPFGFSQIPMTKVAQFSGVSKEVFINLMSSFINRFFQQLPDVIAGLFGFDVSHLKQLLLVPTEDRIDFIVNKYTEALGALSSCPALTFEMRNIQNVRLYHLIFISTHIEGFKAMKEAMNNGTQVPGVFSLSDYTILRKNIQLNLKSKQNDADVADCIFHHFHGQTVSLEIIENFIWLETPFVFRKTPLKILKADGRIINVVDAQTGLPPRIRGTFPDLTADGQKAQWIITFAPLILHLVPVI